MIGLGTGSELVLPRKEGRLEAVASLPTASVSLACGSSLFWPADSIQFRQRKMYYKCLTVYLQKSENF